MNIIEKEIERLRNLSPKEVAEAETFYNNVSNFTEWASKPDSHSNENGEDEKICNIIFTFREKDGVLKDSLDMMMSGENSFNRENEFLLKNIAGMLLISAASVIQAASERENEELKSFIENGEEK